MREPYLVIGNIDHTRTKVQSPQANGIAYGSITPERQYEAQTDS